MLRFSGPDWRVCKIGRAKICNQETKENETDDIILHLWDYLFIHVDFADCCHLQQILGVRRLFV